MTWIIFILMELKYMKSCGDFYFWETFLVPVGTFKIVIKPINYVQYWT